MFIHVRGIILVEDRVLDVSVYLCKLFNIHPSVEAKNKYHSHHKIYYKCEKHPNQSQIQLSNKNPHSTNIVIKADGNIYTLLIYYIYINITKKTHTHNTGLRKAIVRQTTQHTTN